MSHIRSIRREGLLALLAVALAFSGCGPRRYAYAPVTTSSAELVGRPAADYSFPPDAPKGEVKLATLGLSQATPDAARSIQLRMLVTNRSAEPWFIDKSEQKLLIAVGSEKRRVELTEANAQPNAGPSRVEIGPGQTAAVDLFFPLPPGAQDAAEVPAFDAVWRVHAGARLVETRTPFERFLRSSPAMNVPSSKYPYSKDMPREPSDAPGVNWPLHEPIPLPDPMVEPHGP